MKIYSAALLLLLGVSSSFITSETTTFKEEKIAWNENQKLTWKDFRGLPKGSGEFVASTNSGISFAFSYNEKNGIGKVDYTVTTNFYPDLSWYLPKRVNPYILAHEQLHFDISEVHARKLKKELATMPHDRKFKERINTIYNAIEAQRQAMQNEYDSDSDHSNVEAEEYRWRTYVADQLTALDAWK